MKKIITWALVVMLVVAMMPLTAQAAEFLDMPNDWSTQALENAVENGLLEGYNGYIMPDAYLTRAQMAAVITRAFAAYKDASLAAFTDVPATAWYADEMAKGVQMGVFIGSADKLNPEDNITREQAFLVLARAIKLMNPSETALNAFSDKDSVSSWAKDAMACMVQEGYVQGSGGKLNPKAYITRAEFAQVMDNIFKHYISAAGEYTEDYTGNVIVNVPGVTLKGLTINGDLIIGDGVGEGTVTLDGTVVTGRLVVRGGGVNSVRIVGGSDVSAIIIARVDGKVRVYIERGTTVEEVIVDGDEDVIIEGDIGTLLILVPDITVWLTSGSVQNAIIKGENSRLIVGPNAEVDTIAVVAPNVDIEVEGAVNQIGFPENGDGGTVSGTGKVGNVASYADDVVVTTIGAVVYAGQGTSGVYAGAKPVAPGTSEIVEGPSIGGGGGTPPPPTPTLTLNSVQIAGAPVPTNVISGVTYYQIKNNWTADTELLANVTGANFVADQMYSMKVTVETGAGFDIAFTKDVLGSRMNGTKDLNEDSLRAKVEDEFGIDLTTVLDAWTRANPGDTITVKIGIDGGAVLWSANFIVVAA